MFYTLFDNFIHNLFKPLLLFFYAGFLIPQLRIKFDFPQVLYQSLTIYLLLAIGWHGGEELAGLSPSMIGQASGFMMLGFLTNTVIGIAAYFLLRRATRLRKIDAATVAGYYGSDSAGTFVTCLGVLTAGHIAFAPYMPVLLAVMEIPGCLVALVLVSRMRRMGLDKAGNMPGELGYTGNYDKLGPEIHLGSKRLTLPKRYAAHLGSQAELLELEMANVVAEGHAVSGYEAGNGHSGNGHTGNGHSSHRTNGANVGKYASSYASRSEGDGDGDTTLQESHGAVDFDLEETDHTGSIDVSLEHSGKKPATTGTAPREASVGKLLHEVFLNPGSFLLFGGLVIGFISRLQGQQVVAMNDSVFVTLFQGMLCLFLLEMGMTASKRLKDLKKAGWQFVAFALIAPNLFASFGIGVTHLYSLWLGQPFDLGTYALFAVLCGAASYIAVPAVQRMAIPEASPTLPLAASLGLTFSYNVTIGIPVYLMIATALTTYFPVY